MNLDLLVEFANSMLMWIGFGTVLGLIAKAVLGARDAGATLLLGIAGTLAGCAMLKLFYPMEEIKPVSMEGMAGGGGGAFLTLLFYKVLGGYWFIDGDSHFPSSRRRRRRTKSVLEE